MRLSEETVQRLGWQERASCAPANTEHPNPQAYFEGVTKQTRDRCLRECPVREQCLNYALTYNLVGLWGGTSAKERRKIKAQRRRDKVA